MDYRNYSDKKRMKGIYRFVKRVYRNVIERNHRRSLLESYGKESIGLEKKTRSCDSTAVILFKDYKIKRMKDAIGNNYRNAIDVKSNDKKDNREAARRRTSLSLS